jgi:hypothetical protein
MDYCPVAAPTGNAVKDFVHTLKGLNLKAQGREAHPGKPKKDGLTLKGQGFRGQGSFSLSSL